MKIKTETSAGGIVFKREPKLSRKETLWLICQHSYHKGWVFPKGLVADKKTNESIESAALREVEEEGGVKAKIVYPKPVIVSYFFHWPNSPHSKDDKSQLLVKKTVYYFLMEYLSGDPKNHDFEMSDAIFVNVDQVKNSLRFPSDKDAFEKILKIYQKLYGT